MNTPQYANDDAVGGSELSGKLERLLPCPFCGGEPEMLHKGNKFSAKRSVTIKCKQCRVQRTDAAMRFGMAWLEGVATDHWNKRSNVKVTGAEPALSAERPR